MSIITREQIENTRYWIEAFYEACDSLEVRDWINEFFQLDAIVHLNNLSIIQGHSQLIHHYEEYYSLLSFVEHRIKGVDISSDRCYVHVEVTSIAKNDPEQIPVTRKGLMIIEKKLDDEKLNSFHVYIDSTRLIDRIQMHM
ncbi:hypothetical protein I4U23_001287 [Adineta vaga]|nr:hypothetical protein I4U23_001287 [Adineta vaga]